MNVSDNQICRVAELTAVAANEEAQNEGVSDVVLALDVAPTPSRMRAAERLVAGDAHRPAASTSYCSDICVLAMGGTLDKEYFDATSAYQVGEPQAINIFDQGRVRVGYQVESVCRKDSLELTTEDRAALLDKIHATPQKKILVTHGTDTMAETGRWLSERGVGGKTVVLTGAMQPALFSRSDAMFNVGFALGALQALNPGVFVAMNGGVFNPQTVEKCRAQKMFKAVQAP